MNETHSITHDPIYYTTAAFFALLMTALPAILGQPRFLPIIQTLFLTIFVAVALHHRHLRGAINVMAIWLPIQFGTVTLLTRLFPLQLEAAFNDGFAYRGAIAAWFFGGAPHPDAVASNSASYLLEVAGIVIGSLVTAGFVGIWVLMHIVNLAGYGTGILLASILDPGQSLLVIPYWTLLRIAGYAGLIVLCAMPLLTYSWSPSYYWQNYRKLILVSIGLILASFIAQIFLPGIVSRPPPN